MSTFEHFESFVKEYIKGHQPFENWTVTSEDVRKRSGPFLIIFFILSKLFCIISLNKPGRHKVSFVVMHHMYTELVT